MSDTKMTLTVNIDLARIADDVNDMAGEDVETPDTVRTWVEQNDGTVARGLQDAIAALIGEAYD